MSYDFYMNFEVKDEIGVMHYLTGVFQDQNVSIMKMSQHPLEHSDKKNVSISFITHKTKENQITAILENCSKKSDLIKTGKAIRIIA